MVDASYEMATLLIAYQDQSWRKFLHLCTNESLWTEKSAKKKKTPQKKTRKVVWRATGLLERFARELVECEQDALKAQITYVYVAPDESQMCRHTCGHLMCTWAICYCCVFFFWFLLRRGTWRSGIALKISKLSGENDTANVGEKRIFSSSKCHFKSKTFPISMTFCVSKSSTKWNVFNLDIFSTDTNSMAAREEALVDRVGSFSERLSAGWAE